VLGYTLSFLTLREVCGHVACVSKTANKAIAMYLGSTVDLRKRHVDASIEGWEAVAANHLRRHLYAKSRLVPLKISRQSVMVEWYANALQHPTLWEPFFADYQRRPLCSLADVAMQRPLLVMLDAYRHLTSDELKCVIGFVVKYEAKVMSPPTDDSGRPHFELDCSPGGPCKVLHDDVERLRRDVPHLYVLYDHSKWNVQIHSCRIAWLHASNNIELIADLIADRMVPALPAEKRKEIAALWTIHNPARPPSPS
jgi:hypothetical protein